MSQPTNDVRPSPEALLELAQAEGKGRLRIFMGAAPGVGKTYAMLEAAQARKAEGVDIVVGVVETHGRRETAALLAGLEVLPRRSVPYKGRVLEEMDLDALLQRRPQVALVDELAHDNAPGSRHPKRWMDVEELLAAGIDVWTTMNIQHVESLNDVVAQITRVRVRETVPDSVLDVAEIELIDLLPDELQQRLHAGKVYVPEQARLALDHYFSSANLTALRELALRRTAQRVDDQMLQYVHSRGLAGPWAASDRLLVAIRGGEGAAELVRYGKRLADRLKAPWTVIHVETVRDRQAGEVERNRIADTLRLAERLGAETLALPGERVADEILAWAHANTITQIVLGSTHRPAWRDALFGSVPRAVIRGAGEITVHVIPGGGETVPAKRVRAREPGRGRSPWPYVLATLYTAIATAAAWLVEGWVALANISLVFLAPVLLAALSFGLWPALYSAALATLAYNFFFTEPLYTFSIDDPENVTAILFFSIAAVVTSTLAARTRARTLVAREEAARAAALYSFSKKLAGVAAMDDLLWAAAHQIASMLKVEAVMLLPLDGKLLVHAAYPPEDQLDVHDMAAAEWCWAHDQPAGRGSDTLPGTSRLFLPLKTGRGRIGVVGIKRAVAGPLLTPDERRLLDALLDQTAVAIERVQLARDVDRGRVLAETEQLRAALLTSLGHDLKTPLAAILGTITSLRSFGALYDEATRDEMLANAQEEAERLGRFLENMLDMVRLEGGAIGPKRDPIDLDDVVGSALKRVQRITLGHRVAVSIAPDLPLVRLDFVLVEQVLVNLIENAARYAPRSTVIEVAARREAGGVVLEVADEGPGIDPEEAELVFDKFYRGQKRGDGKGGTGLGLAVCKGFIEVMGGTIAVLPRVGRPGSVFRITFPRSLEVEAVPEPALA